MTMYNRYLLGRGNGAGVGWDGSGEDRVGTNAKQKKSQDRPVFNRSI